MTDFADLHDDLRDVARELLAKDEAPDARWRRAADAGWLGLAVPEELGGSGATFAETAVVLEELGRATADVAFIGPAVLAVAAALAVEATGGRDALLADLAAGSVRAAVALAPHADAARASAPFRLDASGRLTGRAELVVDAPGAEHLLVLAETPDGLALVDASDACTVEPEPVLDATRTLGTVAADGVAVPADAVWRFAGDPGAAAQSVLDRGAVAVALDGLGVASAMLDATVAYVGDRHQFGRPIGSFQAVKHQCADALVGLRIGRELVTDAVAALVAEDPDAGIAASRAASDVGEAAVEVVGMAMQLHGGIGYTWESGIHRYLKRALLDRSLLGSPSAHRARVADALWPAG